MGLVPSSLVEFFMGAFAAGVKQAMMQKGKLGLEDYSPQVSC